MSREVARPVPAAQSELLEMACFLAATVEHLPGVASLSALSPEAVTYGPGEAVRGVAVREEPGGWAIRIGVIAVYAPDESLVALASKVRQMVRRALEMRGAPVKRVDVCIDDLFLGDELELHETARENLEVSPPPKPAEMSK